MSVQSPLASRLTVATLLVLTAVTGLVDAVSYLRLGRVFVANMTGNVVFLGLSVDPQSGLSAGASATALAGFTGGAFGAGWAASRLAHRPRQWLGSTLAAEALILTVVAVLTGFGMLAFEGHGREVIIVVLAVALGMQNGTIRHFGVPDLTTTVLTMSLTGLSSDSALAGGKGSRPIRRLGSVLTMLAGALVGAALLQWSPTAVIALAAVSVAAVAGTFLLAGRHEDTRPPLDRSAQQGAAQTGLGQLGPSIEQEKVAHA
jgi:uncharacterized membrane protein YoaK (UPF0700 family)